MIYKYLYIPVYVTGNKDTNIYEGIKKLNLDCNIKLGMSLPEVTLTECNTLVPRRSKNQMVKSYDLI